MRLCYLLGHPVGHSMSAVMHNAAFRELGLDYRYQLRDVPPAELEGFVSSELRRGDFSGANVTIPHKVEIMKHLDEVDQAALKIGAVNTLLSDGGRLKGYNTDGTGAMRGLREAYGSLEGARAVLLGAGGAARAVGYHLSTLVGELIIVNRTLVRGERLADSIRGNEECAASVSAYPYNEEALRRALADADILVNSTPVGMSPHTDETPVVKNLLRPDLLVFDLIYNPMETRLLREAEAVGAKTLNGVNMLVYQGAEAFRLWTAVDAPVGTMMRAVEEALGGGGG